MFLSFQNQGAKISFYEDLGKVEKIRREKISGIGKIKQKEDSEGPRQKNLIPTQVCLFILELHFKPFFILFFFIFYFIQRRIQN
jgi:hypothetical protein